MKLPIIMVAPNGARRSKADHPMLPITINETVEACRACEGAGATGAHLHIRDAEGLHTLDADQYKRLLDKLDKALPNFFAQVTSETAGRYSANDQRDLIHALKPKSISVALREFIPNEAAQSAARDCYHWAFENDVAIQHICYSAKERDRLIALINAGTIPGTRHHVQLVLGAYDGSKKSDANDVASFAHPFINASEDHSFDWMLCAFGQTETDCLVRTIKFGGKARIGFENSLCHSNGQRAESNADRVRELVANLHA